MEALHVASPESKIFLWTNQRNENVIDKYRIIFGVDAYLWKPAAGLEVFAQLSTFRDKIFKKVFELTHREALCCYHHTQPITTALEGAGNSLKLELGREIFLRSGRGQNRIDRAKFKGCLLVIDQEENVRWFLSKVFTLVGYQVLKAHSGYEGLQILWEHSGDVDAVVLNLDMIGSLEGRDVLQIIRRYENETPVVTTSCLSDRLDEGCGLGASISFKKPYDLEKIFEEIEALTDLRKKQRDRFF